MSSKIIASTSSGTALNLSSDTSGILEIQTGSGPTTAMTIDTSQNVGIGQTSPGQKLDVSTSGDIQARIGNSVTGAQFTYDIGRVASTGLLQFYGNQSGATGYIFSGINGERMRIDTSGNLLVGRTTISNPITTVNIQSQVGIGVNNGTNASSMVTDRITFNSPYWYVLNASSTGVNLQNGATSWAAQSDETVKDIIEPISDAANKVLSLRAVIGKYKTDEEGTRRSFLIAQDVQKVLPEAVSLDTNDNTLNLRYTETIPLLVAAIQEQQALITNLTTRLAALEGAK